MQPFDLLFDGINTDVEALFSIPNIALFAFALLSWCAWIIVYNAHAHYLPLKRALELGLAATQAVEDAEDVPAAQAAFAAAFPEIDAVMSSRGPGAAGLRHAWLQYRDTFCSISTRNRCAPPPGRRAISSTWATRRGCWRGGPTSSSRSA